MRYLTWVTLLFALTLTDTRADEIRWNNPTGGRFSDPANWDGGVVPGQDDKPVFDVGGGAGYTVRFDADAQTKELVIPAGGLTLDLAGFTYTTTTASGDASILIGESPDVYAGLGITNGTLVAEGVSAGSLSVRGAGARCNVSGDVTIGHGRLSRVSITDGGVLASTNAVIGATTSADAYVGDAGSTWTNTGKLTVGGSSDGELLISWGGMVSAQAVFVGTAGGFVSRVEVNGPEASLTSTGAVTVGQQAGSRGGTTVAYGGRITASVIEINPTGVLHGDSIVEASIVNEGTVDAGLIPVTGLPPLLRPGTLTIDGDYRQRVGGTLAIDINGVVAGEEYDVLAVTGTATLGGRLFVSLFDPGFPYEHFAPSVGDRFEVLTAASISGRFDVVELPTLPNGLLFDVDYEMNAVTLTVVAAPAPALSHRGLAGATALMLAIAALTIRKRQPEIA